MHKALVIIDMQKGSFTDSTPRFDTQGICQRINNIAQYFRKHKWPVIHIQHDGSKEGEFIPQTQEWEIIEEIKVGKTDLHIQKTANDAFLNSNLHDTLQEMDINEIYVSGCATDFCVNAIILSGLAKNYRVKVLGDCHTTADRLEIKAKDVILLFNFIWSGLIPTKGSVEILSSSVLLKTSL